MRNTVLTYIDRFRRDRHVRLVLGSVLLFLAIIVSLTVYWQLRLSGIAMTNETYCGYEEHTHTEDCYESVLICGLEEIEGHTHSDECFDEEGNLVCEVEECEPHIHTEECYETTLICELEEHVHTVDCLVDLEADIETAVDWEAALPVLTGDLRTDIVNIAYSQIGYTESTANYTLAEDGVTHLGYTRYGAWYGGLYFGSEYSDWDSMFVAFCLDYAGVADEFTYNSGAFAWSVELATLGYYQTADAYTPEIGDVAFIDTDLDGRADVTAIVVSIGDTITVIQGNYADSVALTAYTSADSIIGYANVGFADVTYAEEVSSTVELSEQTLTVWADNSLITISGSLPERAVVTAVPVDVEEVEIEGKEVLLAFDISITYQNNSGETVIFEPESGTISVTIESSEITGGSDVYYVPEEGEPEKLENDSEDGAIAFDAEHFSTYAVTSSDTVVATGTIDNAEGDTDAITWTVYEDSESGERKLVISGEGAIPDYTDGSETPWFGYCSTSANKLNLLIIEEGITAVGDYAFHLNYISEISFPDTLTSIHQFAFYRLSSLTSVTIPDSVIEIGKRAFSGINLIDIDLGEGVQTIGDYAFYGNFPGTEVTIHLPNSLTSFGISAFSQASAYAISSTNTNFYVDSDGVLYSYDKTTLIDYPKNREADSWTVPITVTTIKEGALQNVKKTGAIYFYHQVELCYQCFRESVFSYAYFYDDFELTASNLFAGATSLTSVHLPENATYKIPGYCFSGCTSLQELKIPQGVTEIGGYSLNTTTNLETLYYDAEHITKINAATFGTESTTLPLYDLTIGTNVDYLIANFSYILEHASTLTIEGPNAFYVVEGAFDNAPAPYTGLSGWIYVDGDGVIYTLDESTKEATLIYVPDSVTSLEIPATITDTLDGSDDVTFTATSIAKDAVKEASNLTSVIFEDASNITSLGAYALANAPIASITDEATNTTVDTVDEATALFTNTSISIGYNVFYNTKLTGSAQAEDFATTMDGVQDTFVGDLSINVTKGETTVWQDNTSGGGYVSLTGDTVKFGINANNTSGDSETYRIYIQVTDDDCSTGYTAGETYTSNGATITAVATNDPYTIYLEFTVETGNTVNFSINMLYQSPTSDGGGVTIWGAVVENDVETAETDRIQAFWTTQQDTYTLEKNYNKQESITITASSDDGKVHPSSTMTWQIILNGTDYSTAYGEDYVTVATYTDIMTLPTGMEWDEKVLEAIKAGTVTLRSNALYVGSTEIASLSMTSNSSLSLSGLSISYDETSEQVLLTWRVRNTGSVNMQTNTLTLSIYPEALTVDMDDYDLDATNIITNTATATLTYTYGSSEELTPATAEKSVTGGTGNVKVSKTGTDVTFFGEDVTYTISVYNDGGLEYKDAQTYTLSDDLVNYLYISAENMEKMFEEAADVTGTELTITIANAKLADGGGSTVTDTDGVENSVYVNTGNSDLTETEGNTLVITYDSDNKKYTVTVSGNSTGTYTGTSLVDILQDELGYGVTSTVTYSCVWTLPDDGSGDFVLESGKDYTYNIYATVKSTFQILGSDVRNKYTSSTITLTNKATVISDDETVKETNSASNDVIRREAILSKSVSLDGTNLGTSPMASDGDVLDYTLKFVHYGDGTYDDLPMVDDLYGSQYLLVPYTENSTNGTVNGCDTYDIDGDTEPDYYILGEGTYTDVIVGQDSDGNWLTAATITVESGTDKTFTINSDSYTWSGIHTQIKWYFEHLDGGYYEMEVSYKALVDTDDATSYSIGNIVWMNDRTGSRLYDTLWGGGTIIDFDKNIVVATGSDGDEDKDGLDDDKHTIINADETVTYRLTLQSTGDLGTFVLTGDNIADQLPETYGVFDWSTSNVKISFEVANGTVSGADSLADSSKWSIADSYNGVSGTGIYFITWGDDVAVTFSGNATVYVYVELTYPSDTDWDSYVEKVQGASISNTLYIYRNPINVTHVLAGKGEATLQKGVYALLRKSKASTNSNSSTYYATGTDRSYYNNEDSNYRYVAYYVSLYNEGPTRLYLNNLYDELPDGFTFVTLANSYTPGSSLASVNVIKTLSSSDDLSSWFVKTDSGMTYMSATVTENTSSDGTLVFSISSGSGTHALKYDDEMGQYYLDGGEAIVFGYICQIGETAYTKDTATNTIAMSYTDYTGSGVDVSKESIEARTFASYSDNNDGTCSVKTSVSANLDDGNGNSEWLVSSVPLERGGIKPGVTKKTVSYQTSSLSEAQTYTNSVGYSDLVNWEVTLLNAGTMSIVNYTITDVMPNPYVFTGPVEFKILDSSGATQSYGTLFTINTDSLKSLSELSSTTLSSLSVSALTSSSSSYASATTVNIGTQVQRWAKSTDNNTTLSFNLRFYFDDSNNLVMEIEMTDEGLAVPEGGSMTITYTSYNPTTTYSSMTYINQVTLTPSQEFTSSDIQSGSEVKDDNGKVTGVSAISPVTVASGYATNSYKTVTENSNTAKSTSSDNSIVLESSSSTFTYTLSVENVNDSAISELVIIDNLPFVGDNYTYNENISRNSEFSVVLVSSDFVVKIGDDTLDSSGYTVEYSSTKSGNFSSADRNGTASSDWETLKSTTDLSTVKSIRVIITEDIPAGKTVSVSFNAEISGSDAKPGQVAWNNFGYWYTIDSASVELEAMTLVVGVKTPSAPELTKELIDLAGDSYSVAEDTEFTFVVYEGEELKNNGESYTSQTELVAALGSANTAYKIVTLTVNKDASTSETLVLTDSNELTWVNGEKYTIAEFVTDANYDFKEWSEGNSKLSTSNSYTFTYNSATTLSLTCTNVYETWDLTLTKVELGNTSTTLEGAVFALYTDDATQKMSDDDYGKLTIQPNKEITVNSSAWYLMSVETTDKDGAIKWSDLTEESYYLVEVKAPDGYNVDSIPLLVERSEDSNSRSITVTNTPGVELPEAGGINLSVAYAVGSLMILASAIGLVVRRKRI